MYREKCIGFIASFLIALVLALPFYTANAYAAINSVSAKGSDNIEGYIRQKDVINFDVDVFIEGDDTITNEQVILGQNIKFDNCKPAISQGFACSLKYPKTPENFDAASIPYTISLFKDDKTLDSKKSGNAIVDNKAPKLTLSINKNKFSSQDTATISYDATDFAYKEDSAVNECVGIKNIEFYTLDNTFKRTEEITTNDCNAKSSIDVELKAFKDGMNAIFAKSTDKFNQVSQAVSVTFDVDALSPTILTETFVIVRKGFTISSFSNNKVPVDVMVNISEKELESVTADLSALNPDPSLKNAKALCTKADDKNVCKWPIELNPGSEGVKSMTINALDKLGNKATATISKQLSKDDKGPVVESLATTAAKEGKLYAKPTGNTVIAVLDEATGLAKEDVFLHVGSSKLAANKCSKEGKWSCTWEDVSFDSSSSMDIEADTIDVLGNPSQGKKADVVIDKEMPVLKGRISTKPVSGFTEAIPNIFRVGDRIAVEANLTDETGITATADFSKFITDATKVAGACKNVEGNKHTCTWLTDKINLAASGNIIFKFTDFGGNTLTKEELLETIGLDATEVPNFWTHAVECSPKTLDRELGTLIEQRVYCHVKLESTKEVSTVLIGKPECTDKAKLLKNAEIINTEPGSTSPIIKLTLKKNELRIEEDANFTCSIGIFSKIKATNTITKNPEIENIFINVKFYELPLGEVGAKVEEKIKDAKRSAQGIWETIGGLNKAVNTGKRICQGFGVIYNVVSIWTLITAGQKTAADAAADSVVGAPAAPQLAAQGTISCFTQQGAETAADKGWVTTGGKFCKFVNCEWAPWVLEDYRNFVVNQINKLPLGETLPGPGRGAAPSRGFEQPAAGGEIAGLAGYLNPYGNLVSATALGCIPGIIYNIDKIRQIKCLYADCLENAVANGLPITACEDQKHYATCKYVVGEAFAALIYPAVIDHFINIAKEALANPFAAAGVVVGAVCSYTCPDPPPAASVRYTACAVFKVASKLGEVLENIRGLAREGFKIRQDYCSRIDFSDLEEEEESEESAQ